MTIPSDQGRDHHGVHVGDLNTARFRSCREQLVAGNEGGDAGLADHADPGLAQGTEHSQVLRPEDAAGTEDGYALGDVLTRATHVPPCGHGLVDEDRFAIGPGGFRTARRHLCPRAWAPPLRPGRLRRDRRSIRMRARAETGPRIGKSPVCRPRRQTFLRQRRRIHPLPRDRRRAQEKERQCRGREPGRKLEPVEHLRPRAARRATRSSRSVRRCWCGS